LDAGVPDTATLDGLDPEQRLVAEALRGPLCVLAGAGTGKTRAITHRVAHLVHTGTAPVSQVLAVTFTTRAAAELRDRLRRLGVPGVQARTFHSAALRQLAFFYPRVVGGELPPVMDSKFRLVAEAAGRLGLVLDRTEIRDVASELEWAKATCVPPEGYVAAVGTAGRQPALPPAEVARLFAAYERLKEDRPVLDFEDLLMLAAVSIERHPGVAEEVRSRYRHFVVDEYQDVNPLQQRLLEAWLGDRDDVCVVGDPNQTIYSFTGATSAYLLGFPARHPGATVVRLVRDYRSSPEVVQVANRLIAGAPATGPRLELLAQRPSGPAPVLVVYDDEPAEAAGVATSVVALLRAGVTPAEVAVLFRTNGQSEAYEASLAEAGVPYQVRGSERFFDRPEVRQAVVLLRGAARSEPPSGGLADQVRHVLSSMGWTAQPPAGSGAVRERWDSIAALVSLADELADRQPDVGLEDFAAELAERAAAQHAPPIDGVTLASLHAAKGLEWDAVFVVGLTDGMLPISYATTAEQVEEERRLLYVGMTRARRHLSLSWARSRSPGGRGSRQPSRFLDGLLPTAGAGRADGRGGRDRGRGGRGGPPRCRVCGKGLLDAVGVKLGRCVGCPADMDEALFERLRVWRLERSRELSQPAFCVFTDATLTAIAERRPRSPGELAGIAGVGRAKLDRYGADVLALVGESPS
jgi:DNA helicase II / ATP-dependent DNA helicase PcrA